jgi:hypothetical protein
MAATGGLSSTFEVMIRQDAADQETLTTTSGLGRTGTLLGIRVDCTNITASTTTIQCSKVASNGAGAATALHAPYTCPANSKLGGTDGDVIWLDPTAANTALLETDALRVVVGGADSQVAVHFVIGAAGNGVAVPITEVDT